MRALLRRFGEWTTRHAFACRVIGLVAVATLTAMLSISAERQRVREEEAAAMIAEWERRPIVYICERYPGEQIVFDRKDPAGPDAQPDAEPRKMIFKGSICDSILSRRGDARDGK